MTNVLIIGYGNTLRGDDAVGVRAGERIAERFPAVRCLMRHQLTPELAADVAEARQVIFLDADASAADLTLHIVQEHEASHPRSHSVSPSYLLALARELYGRAPASAHAIGIPAVAFEISEQLSPLAEQGVEQAVRMAAQLIENGRAE